MTNADTTQRIQQIRAIDAADNQGDFWKLRVAAVQLADDCEALQQQRDAAFKMSKCECGTDEACENLVKHLRQCDALQQQLAQVAALPEQWRVKYHSSAVKLAADELDAILKGTSPKPSEV